MFSMNLFSQSGLSLSEAIMFISRLSRVGTWMVKDLCKGMSLLKTYFSVDFVFNFHSSYYVDLTQR